MNRGAVVRKTALGEEEIQTRAHGLERNLRYVLILVDGSSNVDQIVAKGAGMPDVEGSLARLAAEGYVDIEGYSSGASATTGDVTAMKVSLIAIARELLGADAGKVISKIEAAPDSREGLLEVVSQCKKVVRLLIDEDKAEALMTRCRAVLDGISTAG
ncbi:MAG: hypothetical protein M0R77_11525 [Gammaproteobacteria bacterium]|nr:hypothetical protein [Gammaproteobacteria bacterium]